MMRFSWTLGALVLISSPAVAEYAVVCPINLDYCYKKPVLNQKRDEDEFNEIKQRIDRWEYELKTGRKPFDP
jgi:hypothetical protein